MYDVDREGIDEVLKYSRQKLEAIQPWLHITEEELVQNELLILALERAAHLAIEAIVDVGNKLIDGFIMRDPGSYEDIIEILRDEQVIPEQDAILLKEFVAYRKILAHQYTKTNSIELHHLLKKVFATILQFEGHLRRYLSKELGI
ncbi:DUF86 domain-containing protein [Tepidibacillus infernus]|uniref:DUF86 domain-containing protein n=1 Tax=Tepidibacillus decaturensis TaxID=1413211 RepID=A0A135L5Q8_9BACI|nr:DUF86 domain-containing protein [Tepidibacillus decaturensis]KXG44183.1 hypothetical protein U473_09355 [Tepidibacillus decaturensis]